jgi:hypothetical protein
MKRFFLFALVLLTAAAVPAFAKEMKEMKHSHSGAKPEWSMNATAIEACSCPMFCQCYFNAEPAGHGMHMEHAAGEMKDMDHFCRFNNAYKVNKGWYKGTSLDGAKFWIYGDLGGDFSKGQMDWAVVTFDKATTKEQQEGIAQIASHLFPVKWNSLTTAVGDIDWNATKQEAVAKLDDGKTAEVKLHKFQGMTSDPVVIKNLKYWGAPKNDGFIMMPNEIEALRTGDKPFEYHGTNGFMITVDINSTNAPPAAGS